MRIIKTLLKLIVGLAVAIPLGVILMGLTVGIVGTVLVLAVAALKLACVALLVVGAFKVGKLLFGSKQPTPAAQTYSLPKPDPYYEAAVREIDNELGHVGRR